MARGKATVVKKSGKAAAVPSRASARECRPAAKLREESEMAVVVASPVRAPTPRKNSSDESSIRALMIQLLHVKYDVLVLAIRVAAGNVPDEDGEIVTQAMLDQSHVNFEKLFLDFEKLVEGADAIRGQYTREDMRLVMAVDSKRGFAEECSAQEDEINSSPEAEFLDPVAKAALVALRQKFEQTQLKLQFRSDEIAGIVRGDGLGPVVLPGVVRAKKTTAAVAPPVEPSDDDECDESETHSVAETFGIVTPLKKVAVPRQASGAAVAAVNTAANLAAAAVTLGHRGSAKPSMFSGYSIASGYDYLLEYKELSVPDPDYPETRYLDRIQVSALQPSMVAPILVFKDIGADDEADWGSLQPLVAAVYAVIADGNDGVTNLMLVYAEEAYSDAHTYPMCLSFQCGGGLGSSTILVYSELAIRTQAIDADVRRALNTAGVVNPIAPSTPSSSRSTTTVQLGASGYAVEKTGGKSSAEWIPLRRALHGDKSKIYFFTKGDQDAKLSGNAQLLTRIRNQGRGTTQIMSLPAMQGLLLVKLLAFCFCVTIDFVGTGANKTPDALHICMFMDTPSPGVFFKFTKSTEIITMFENLEKVCMAIFQESYGDPHPHFARCFDDIKDSLKDDNPDTEIKHCSINYQVWKVEQLVVEWANLYTNEDYASMGRADFLALNIRTLSIDKEAWRRDHGQYDKARIPVQVQAPPDGKAPVVENAKVARYTKAERKAYNRAGSPRAVHTPALPGALGAGRGAGGRGAGRGGGVQYAGANKPAAAPIVAQPPRQGGGGGRGAKGPASICLRDTLHARDPIAWPTNCNVEKDTGAACRHRHDVVLTNAGKFSPADKASVLASMQNMKGEFADQAREYIENHM